MQCRDVDEAPAPPNAPPGEAPDEAALPEIAPGAPLPEVLRVWGLAFLAVLVARSLGAFVPVLAPYGGLFVGAAFLLLALRMAARERAGLARFGIALGGLLGPAQDDGRPAGPLGLFELARTLWRARAAALREASVALGLAALIFPPYVLAFHALEIPVRPAGAFDLGAMVSAALGQLVVIALPEEVFFRGYVQTRLGDAFGPPRSALGRLLGVAPKTLALQALLFGAVHLASPAPNPARLATFFPGLLFGVLRARRGDVGAAILFHALCNVLAELLYRGWV
ncbi:MAG: type II CAAX endopeptidase family protein [Myxococcota bacterium]